MDGRYVRGRAFNLSLLAAAHAAQDEPERACAAGRQALDLTVRLTSARSVRYVRDVVRRLRPRADVPAVRDGYHRVMCPAAMRKLRCPLRPESMTLDRSRPEILTPPAHPPACCAQQTITVPPAVTTKTRQKHDYPSAEHRRSYTRRTASERTFSTIKDPATTSIARGWCRLMGLTPLALWLACLLAVRNQRILNTFGARQADTARRAAAGLPPRTRNGGARPWPRPPPARHNNPPPVHATPATPHTAIPRPPHRSHTPTTGPATKPRAPATSQTRSSQPARNVRPKREHRHW
jgi:hypothetical protein